MNRAGKNRVTFISSNLNDHSITVKFLLRFGVRHSVNPMAPGVRFVTKNAIGLWQKTRSKSQGIRRIDVHVYQSMGWLTCQNSNVQRKPIEILLDFIVRYPKFRPSPIDRFLRFELDRDGSKAKAYVLRYTFLNINIVC